MTGPCASLRAELRAVESDYPGWHCWLSDAGTVCGTTVTRCPWHGGGCTLDAPTPDVMRQCIARTEQRWSRDRTWAA